MNKEIEECRHIWLNCFDTTQEQLYCYKCMKTKNYEEEFYFYGYTT